MELRRIRLVSLSIVMMLAAACGTSNQDSTATTGSGDPRTTTTEQVQATEDLREFLIGTRWTIVEIDDFAPGWDLESDEPSLGFTTEELSGEAFGVEDAVIDSFNVVIGCAGAGRALVWTEEGFETPVDHPSGVVFATGGPACDGPNEGKPRPNFTGQHGKFTVTIVDTDVIKIERADGAPDGVYTITAERIG